MKWEDKLLGCRFTLVTDHKGLKYFGTQKNLLDRQVQWWEFLSCFNFTIMHVDGVDNKVVDCLSHYYENDTSDDTHSENTYVNTDIWLDPDANYCQLTTTGNCVQQRQGGQSALLNNKNLITSRLRF